jgi:hypothetical protein
MFILCLCLFRDAYLTLGGAGVCLAAAVSVGGSDWCLCYLLLLSVSCCIQLCSSFRSGDGTCTGICWALAMHTVFWMLYGCVSI